MNKLVLKLLSHFCQMMWFCFVHIYKKNVGHNKMVYWAIIFICYSVKENVRYDFDDIDGDFKENIVRWVSLHRAPDIYRKNSKNWDTWNNYHNCPTFGTVGFYSAVLCSKDADRITNREDPDQTAPWGAVWSGSALFAQTYLSQYLKLLR